MRRQKNIEIAQENREIVIKGYYKKHEKRIPLLFQESPEERQKKIKSACVYYPSDLDRIAEDCGNGHGIRKEAYLSRSEKHKLYMVNGDTFSVALALPGRTVSLNFANAHHPGGGYRHGARAQEEDLCRRSTLYASLSGEEAKAAYAYQKGNTIPVYTDCMILSEYVSVFRDKDYKLLDSPRITSVISAAAPNRNKVACAVPLGILKETFRKRIRGIVSLAAAKGFQNLVLGAWGCGAFGNDPYMVAKGFYEVLINEKFLQYFEQVVFAILEPEEGENIAAFSEVFHTEICSQPLSPALKETLKRGHWNADEHGNMYNGGMKNGKYEGHGRLKCMDGSFYEGDFFQGMEEGYGRKVFPDGNIYIGQFLAGAAHGMGRITYKNGITRYGIFEMNWLAQEGNEQKIYKLLAEKGLLRLPVASFLHGGE